MFKLGKLIEGAQRTLKMDNGFLMGAFAAATLTVSGCGITVQRDLSTAKASEVVFDDMCKLQDYFDGLKDTSLSPPAEAFAQDMTTDKGTSGGRTRFVFASDFQLHHLKKVLNENWKRLPEEVPDAQKVEVEVRWSEKAGVKRVVTNEEAVIQVGDKSFFLPYHVCLSDMLFGESLYDTRRAFLGLPTPEPSPFARPVQPVETNSPPRPRVLAGPLPVPASRAGGAAVTQVEDGADVPVTPVRPTPVTEPSDDPEDDSFVPPSPATSSAAPAASVVPAPTASR